MPSNKEFLTFVNARDFARSFNLKNVSEWVSFCKKKKRPSNIPAAPDKFYKDRGWISWQDWLSTKGD